VLGIILRVVLVIAPVAGDGGDHDLIGFAARQSPFRKSPIAFRLRKVS
jgi:hypothetical protein